MIRDVLTNIKNLKDKEKEEKQLSQRRLQQEFVNKLLSERQARGTNNGK